MAAVLLAGHMLALASAISWVCQLKSENSRLRQNQALLLRGERTRMERRVTKDGRNAMAIEALTLRVGELSRQGDSLLLVARSLGIRNRRLQELARTAYRTQTVVRTMVRDSVVKIAPGRTDTLPCLSYRDPWLPSRRQFQRRDTCARHARHRCASHTPPFPFLPLGMQGGEDAGRRAKPAHAAHVHAIRAAGRLGTFSFILI